jgi:glyoxylase-like metal-dependent hydrolase (beta-lactamase superfamily II)
MNLQAFFDPATATLTYLVWDEGTRAAAVIDPVLDYDPLASRTSTASVDAVSRAIDERQLRPLWILETHAHADHLTGAQVLKRRYDARIVIGTRITEVQALFKGVFDLPASFRPDGSQFDRLLRHGERLPLGALEVSVIATPGHTPACVTYAIGDAVFTGDALFMDDYGTGRTDFPAGSADALYDSVHDRLYSLPDETRVFVGHDYRPGGRPLRYETTIGLSKRRNPQLRAATTRDEFVRFRTERDAQLDPPRLLYPSVQVNIDAGRLPAPHENGRRYLVVPLHASGDDAIQP